MARALLLAGCGLSGCLIPVAVPPARVDVGYGPTAGVADTLHLAAGASLASGQRRHDAKLDVGAGYLLEARPGTEAPAAHGAYLAVDWMQSSRRARTSLGLRAGALHADGQTGGALAVRLSRELYKTGQGPWESDDRCGTAAGWWTGSGGVGVYAESGLLQLPGAEPGWSTTIGLTLRTPALAGVGFVIPGCK
jgi:hypothetical protein